MAEPEIERALADLQPLLRRLDLLLARAVAAAEAAYGPEAAGDPYRGLYINRAEVERLLVRAPGVPVLRPVASPAPGHAGSAESAPPPEAGDGASARAGGFGALFGGLFGSRSGAEDKPADAPERPDRGRAAPAESPTENGTENGIGPAPAASSAAPIDAGGPDEASDPDAMPADGPMAWLAQAFGLAPVDLDILLIALAPELDLRYERLYAYLQDDVTRRRPSVDLALNLLCESAADKLAARAQLAPDAPLRHHGLVRLVPDPSQVQPPLLAHYLKLDEQITRLLLGQAGLDERLAPIGELVEPLADLDDLPVRPEVKQVLPPLVAQARAVGRPLRLYFHGPRGAGKRRAAEALAAAVGAPLLAVDLERAAAQDRDFDDLVRVMLRDAWFRGAVLYIEGLAALREAAGRLDDRLFAALQVDAGVVILAGAEAWAPWGRGPLGVTEVSLAIPEFDNRRACWAESLAQAGIDLDEAELDALAGRFQLTPDQIAEAVVGAYQQARGRAIGGAAEAEGADGALRVALDPAAAPAALRLADLFAAARGQAGHGLGALARRIAPLYGWDDIVLPEASRLQLRQICQQVVHRHRVLDDWGFGRRLSLGKGVSALFAGPSGTGKTMAAEIIAGELGLDLYKIDLSGVVSKYIGETEKNLDRIFAAAEHANAILFFDEADALFGKRSEVRDAHDRYANIETAYLLQKMEQFEGVAILATNLRQNMDEAFVRRLQFIVEFPFPDEAQRQQIWRVLFPAAAPRDAAIDFPFLARQFRLSGGNIKNVVLGAAYLAAADGGYIGMPHLVAATRREYQKMGKVLPEGELGAYAGGALAVQ